MLLFRVVLLSAVVVAGVLAAGSAEAARRALVIGNQNYDNLEDLEKSARDATSYGDLFTARGFEQVTIHHDLTRQQMDQAMADFIGSISPGDTAVFVYAGHGWSDGKQNYILATDAPKAGSANYLTRVSFPIRNGATGIVDEMENRGASLKVAIIDACRDNPFEASDGTRGAGLSRGLNRMSEPPPAGTFLVFSAGAGQTALDRLAADDGDPNGVFTRTFLKYLKQDLTLLDATKATQDVVYQMAKTAVGVDQQPALYDETVGNRACLWDRCSPLVLTDPSEGAWSRIERSINPADFQGFIQIFPDSPHRADAERLYAASIELGAPPEDAPAVQAPEDTHLAMVDPAKLNGSQSLLLEASDSGTTGAVPFSGTVSWSRGFDETGYSTLVGKASIPARNLDVDILIRKNSDMSLPASHLMEVNFHVTDSFVGGSIAGLPGVLLKNEELVQGTPLVGASARVVGNSHLFAFSANAEDVANNLQLLTSRKWMDLALIYATGKRAIITLEEDEAAVALFKSVVEEWGRQVTPTVDASSDQLQGATAGGAYVQLSSKPTEVDAKASMKTTASRLRDLLGGRDLAVRRVDLGQRGTWYRVVLPTPSFEEAVETCKNLKANGVDCVPLRG